MKAKWITIKMLRGDAKLIQEALERTISSSTSDPERFEHILDAWIEIVENYPASAASATIPEHMEDDFDDAF